MPTKQHEFMSLRGNATFIASLTPGTRVWAHWEPTKLFAGTVEEIQSNEVCVQFDDGDKTWVMSDQVMPLLLEEGMQVMARWQMEHAFFPGTITRVDGERIYIEYDDGDEEWTTPAALGIPCEPFIPTAQANVPRHGRFFALLAFVILLFIVLLLVWLVWK